MNPYDSYIACVHRTQEIDCAALTVKDIEDRPPSTENAGNGIELPKLDDFFRFLPSKNIQNGAWNIDSSVKTCDWV